MKLRLTLLAVFAILTANAQTFLRAKPGQQLTFKEMQLQFHEWSQQNDLNKTKGWKYYKRWETEMQLHTDAKGEPADPSEYINAAIEAAKMKEIAASSKTMSSSAWYPLGPNIVPNNLTGYMENGIGRINCMAFDPSSTSTYYVGVAQGGLWKTVNNGQSWTPLTDNLPITRISDILIDPNNTSTIYVSLCDYEYIGFGLFLNGRKRNTHYGLGVYKTIDGGTTWQPTGLSFQLTDGDASLIRKMVIDPANSSRLVACGVSGMYRSLDAGATWTKTLDSLFWDVAQDPVNPNVLYAASGWVMNSNQGNAAIYKSTDFGATWTMLSTGIPSTGSVQRIKLAIAPSDNNYIYAVAVDDQSGLYGIYKSTNAGSSWTYIPPTLNILEWAQGTSSGGQGTYDLGLCVSMQNRDKIYVGGINIWCSTNGGQSFDPCTNWTNAQGPTIHCDIHYITQQPVTGNYFVCSDGGIYRTSDIIPGSWSNTQWPTLWSNISSGLTVTSFYRISSSRNNTGRLLAGAQDNASIYFDGSSWSTILGGDGMDNYLDPLDDNVIIGSAQYGDFYYSNDNGMSSFGLTPNIYSEPAEWTSPLVADYNQYGTLYAGFSNVSKSTDGGFTWNVISSFPVPGFYDHELSALAVANSNSNVIYAAKRVRYEYQVPGALYKTTDGGNTWSDITAGLPDSLYYTSVEISESDANVAYITMAGFSAGNKIFMTNNGGTTWQNISYNLPNIPVNCVKHIPGTNKIIAASDIGLYTLDLSNLPSTWTPYGTGLPNVIISDIEFNTALNKIYVCTFGRGIWASDLNELVGIKDPVASSLNVQLYPSINDGSFTIEVSGMSKELQLDIIDVTGRITYSSKLEGLSTYQQHPSLSPGLYYARVSGNGYSGVKSFVVK
jgi:photosystem II stability/assembly factor-like uncharacterized protein